MIDGILSMKEG